MTLLQTVRTHPRYIAFGFLHFFSSAVGQTYFVGLFVAAVTAQLGWAEGTFAALYSGATLAAAFTLPVVGAQVDKYRVRYVSTAVALVLATALSLLGSTGHIAVFAVALYLTRLGGQGVLPLIASTVIGRYFVAGRGAALSATNIGKSIAEVLVPPLAVALMASVGYAWVWYTAAGWMLLLFLPAAWLLIPRHDSFQRADTAAVAYDNAVAGDVQAVSLTRGEALRGRFLRCILPAYVFSPLVLTGVVFTQTLIAEQRGYTAAWMALGVSAYGIARSVLVLVGGGLVDHYGTTWVLRLIHLPVLAGLVVLALLDHRLSIPLFFVLCGSSMGVESVLWPSLWAERYGPRYLGSIKSAIRVFMVLGTAVSPLLFTWGLGYSLEAVAWVAVVYGVLAVGLIWWAVRGG